MRVQSSKALFTRAKITLGLVISITIVSFSLSSHSAFALGSEKALEQQAESMLSQTPDHFRALFIRAQALSQLGQIDKAVNVYESILKSDNKPADILPELYNNLAALYAKQGRLELARQTLEDGIATNKQYKTLYENLSAIYVEMARGAYGKALNLDVKSNVVALKSLQLESVQLASVNPSDSSKLLAQNNNKKPVAQTAQIALLSEATPNETGPVPAPKEVAVVKENKVKIVEKPEIKTVFTQKKAPAINKKEVITALHGWAAAWSAQEVDLYLSYYGKDFKPVKLSKEVWAVQRRIRLSKPRWVNVRLNNFTVKPKSGSKAVVQLVQDYRADNYHDKTKKQFVMQRTVNGWRILSEQSLAVIR